MGIPWLSAPLPSCCTILESPWPTMPAPLQLSIYIPACSRRNKDGNQDACPAPVPRASEVLRNPQQPRTVSCLHQREYVVFR